MFAKSKVSQSMIDAVKQVVETAPIKEPTPTGMRVYGGSYGNSAKAKHDQTKKDIDNLKGPKDKEMKEELKGNQDKIDANHNGKIDAQDFKILRGKKKMREGLEFADKLLETVRKSDVPAYLRKAKGDTPLTMADAKGPKKDSISAPENLAKSRNEEVEQIEEKEESKKKPAWLLAAELKAEKREGKLKEELEQIEERDEGKPGLMFKKIAAKASKEYGSKEAGNRVAGAIRKKVLAKEEVTEQELDEALNEVLSKDATAGDWIHDFIHSDNPKFAGKSKAERKKMALGAYYGHHKEETDANCTTDTLAGRLPGGKINAFKSYKKKLKGDLENDPEENKPESTPARASIHAEATIAGTPGWEPMKKDVKDKSGSVHTPMSRARDLAKMALKRVQDKTKIKN